jgi:hypothetical protein
MHQAIPTAAKGPRFRMARSPDAIPDGSKDRFQRIIMWVFPRQRNPEK